MGLMFLGSRLQYERLSHRRLSSNGSEVGMVSENRNECTVCVAAGLTKSEGQIIMSSGNAKLSNCIRKRQELPEYCKQLIAVKKG